MALTRKMLKAMGIEDEKIDQIVEAHTETVDALKKERDEARTEADRLPDVQKQLDKLKQEREEADGKDKWKLKYDALKDEFDQYKSGIDAEKTKEAKEKALKEFLLGIGIDEKRVAAVVRVTDLDGIEIEDGKMKDADGKLAEEYKKEWADFIVTKSNKTPPPDTPPVNNGGGGGMTREQIMKIKDSGERQKAIADNHELFGF